MLNRIDYQEEGEAPENTFEDEEGKKTIRFSVSGRFMTFLARTFWLEGQFERAVRFLTESVGIEEGDAFLIVRGKKTLKGWDKLTIVDDDAEIPPMEELAERIPKHPDISPEEVRRLLDEMEAEEDEEDVEIGEPSSPFQQMRDKAMLIIDSIGDEKMARVIDGQLDLLEGKEVSGKESPLSFDTGWLRRDGRFYGCKPGQHIALSRKLAGPHSENAELELEQQGWIKVSASRWHGVKKPSKRQRDTIFDWCLIHGMNFEWNGQRTSYQDWLEEVDR